MNDRQNPDDDADQPHAMARPAWVPDARLPRVDLMHDTDITQIFEGEPEPWF